MLFDVFYVLLGKLFFNVIIFIFYKCYFFVWNILVYNDFINFVCRVCLEEFFLINFWFVDCSKNYKCNKYLFG